MINLNINHPVKKWVLAVSKKDKFKYELTDQNFLIEILDSKFNLITDQKIKNRVVSIIEKLDESTLERVLLKSYLYLMIGNITRSDNLMLKIVNMKPLDFYQGHKLKDDKLNEIIRANLDKILMKFSRHPADRTVFELLIGYLKIFVTQKDIIQILDNVYENEILDKLELSYVSQKAPDLCKFLKLKSLKPQSYQHALQDTKTYSSEFQLKWVWLQLGFPTFYNEEHLKAVFEIDKLNPIWTYYLLSDEKFAEIYRTWSGRKTPTQQRLFLRERLKQEETFMLALFKLIEMGDLDESLVIEASNFQLK